MNFLIVIWIWIILLLFLFVWLNFFLILFLTFCFLFLFVYCRAREERQAPLSEDLTCRSFLLFFVAHLWTEKRKKFKNEHRMHWFVHACHSQKVSWRQQADTWQPAKPNLRFSSGPWTLKLKGKKKKRKKKRKKKKHKIRFLRDLSSSSLCVDSSLIQLYCVLCDRIEGLSSLLKEPWRQKRRTRTQVRDLWKKKKKKMKKKKKKKFSESEKEEQFNPASSW